MLIHGHTHVHGVWPQADYTYINPGSAALPKEGRPRSYMTYENGTFTIKQLENGSPADRGRWLKVDWASTLTERYTTSLNLLVKDRIGLLMDVAAALSTLNVNVVSIQSVTKGEHAYISLSKEVKNAAEIKLVMNKLIAIKDVLEVTRTGKAQ